MIKTIEPIIGRTNYGGGHPIILPLPCYMIATYDENNNPDLMMVAYGGQCDYNKIIVYLSPHHKTTANLRLKRAFTLSFASASTIIGSDYCGIISANKYPNKVKDAGFTIIDSPNVNAPIICEYPIALECKVKDLRLCKDEHTRVIGEIINMSVDNNYIGTDNKIDLDKVRPVVYDSSHNTYRVIGEIVGRAFKSGKEIINKIKYNHDKRTH